MRIKFDQDYTLYSRHLGLTISRTFIKNEIYDVEISNKESRIGYEVVDLKSPDGNLFRGVITSCFTILDKPIKKFKVSVSAFKELIEDLEDEMKERTDAIKEEAKYKNFSDCLEFTHYNTILAKVVDKMKSLLVEVD